MPGVGLSSATVEAAAEAAAGAAADALDACQDMVDSHAEAVTIEVTVNAPDPK